jgi:uncharacterized protein (UPF0261 family)
MSVLVLSSLNTCRDECDFVAARLSEAGRKPVVCDTSQPDHLLEELEQVSGMVPGSSAPRGPAPLPPGPDRALTLAFLLRHILDPEESGTRWEGLLVLGDRSLTQVVGPALARQVDDLPAVLVVMEPGYPVPPALPGLAVFHAPGGVRSAEPIGQALLARAVAALVNWGEPTPAEQPLVGLSWGVNTAEAAARLRSLLVAGGIGVLGFEASGMGGFLLEGMVRAGLLDGVLDLDLSELIDQRLGGERGAGPDRLTACGLASVPQVIIPGGVDGVQFPSWAAVPERYRRRPRVALGSGSVLVRTTPEENDELGKEIAYKASASPAPTVLMFPQQGLSSRDAPGEPFHDPAADTTLFQSLCNWMSPQVRLIDQEVGVNDGPFLEEAVRRLGKMVQTAGPP